jgi:hypothetical protein
MQEEYLFHVLDTQFSERIFTFLLCCARTSCGEMHFYPL